MATAGAGEAADINLIKTIISGYVDISATDKTTLTKTNMAKCFTACDLAAYKTSLDVSCWGLHCDEKKRCTIDICAKGLIDDIAADFIKSKKSLKVKPEKNDPDVQKLANDIRLKIAKKAKSVPSGKGPIKTDATTKRLTDVKSYTGSHKERFNEDGSGKGKGGRQEAVSDSGYVGNYKGQGTYKK